MVESSTRAEAWNSVQYQWPVGTEVAFAKKAGVMKGTVHGVLIEITDRREVAVNYRVMVKNTTGRDRHHEVVPAGQITKTLDEAWEIFRHL